MVHSLRQTGLCELCSTLTGVGGVVRVGWAGFSRVGGAGWGSGWVDVSGGLVTWYLVEGASTAVFNTVFVLHNKLCLFSLCCTKYLITNIFNLRIDPSSIATAEVTSLLLMILPRCQATLR